MSKHVNEEKEKKKKRWYLALLILLLLLLISSCSVTIWSVFFRDTTPVLAPDYIPPEIEENATETPDKDDEKLEHSEGGGAVSMEYQKEATIDLSDRMVNFEFKNPGESNQDMLIQVVVQGVVVAQSGRLPPGYEVGRLSLFENAKLMPGKHNGHFAVYFYNNTGEKAAVDSIIELVVTVQE